MNSTPDEADDTPQDPVEPSEPVTPAEPVEPPQPPAPGDVPPPPPPGPVLPPPESAGVPPVPPYGPGAGAPPGGYAYPAPGSKPRSFGARVGIGVAIGFGAYVLGVVLMLATMNFVGGNIIGMFWPYILVAAVAIVLMFFAKTRPIATGVLIVSAAAWIIVLGPCLALLSGY